MPQPTIPELVDRINQAIRVDDDLALFDAGDALAARIGREATLALIRGLLREQRSSTVALQLMAPPDVRFA